jgi:hypothetical protein
VPWTLVYYSSQILFFGAELTQAYANHFGVKLEPKPNARWRQPQPIAGTLKPHVYAAQQEQDRKVQLVSEPKDQVDALRVARDQLHAHSDAPLSPPNSGRSPDYRGGLTHLDPFQARSAIYAGLCALPVA